MYPLSSIVFELQGPVEEFLLGLTSNTLDKPRNAFLNVHGKIIATFNQIILNAHHALIVVEKFAAETLLNHVERFARLSKVSIQRVDYKVYFGLTEKYQIQKDEFVIQQHKGQIILTRSEIPITVTEEEFTLFRLAHHIPLQGVDYRDEFLLNVDEGEFASYTKGCFLGQEPIAKVHHRSKPTWKLVVKSESECSLEEKEKMTSKVLDPRTGQIKGFVFTLNQ